MVRWVRLTVAMAAFAFGMVAFGALAGAQTEDPYVEVDSTTTIPGDPGDPGDPGPEVLGESVSRGAAQPSALAFTGTEVAGMAVIALGLIGIGGAAVVASRKRAEID